MAHARRPSLGALFLLLAACFAGMAIWAARAGGGAWIIAATAGLLALWLGEQAFRALR